MQYKINIYIILILFFCFENIYAQQNYIFLNKDYNIYYEKYLYKKDYRFHTSIKPYLESEIDKYISDTTDVFPFDAYNNYPQGIAGKILKRIGNKNLITVDTNDFQLRINPLFDFTLGKENSLSKEYPLYTNTRGFIVQGNVGKKFSFTSTFLENQAIVPSYIDDFIKSLPLSQVMPGQGKVRSFKNGYDYASASGYISFEPYKYFNIQFGQDKNFIGDGYRSLFLSDNAFNYPFLKITTSIWHIKYVNLYTQYLDLTNDGYKHGRGFPKKYANYHYLNWSISKRLQLGIFEGVVWQNRDTLGNPRGTDISYLNPVIFYRPIEFSLGSPDNMLLGLNARFNINNNSYLYYQLLLDDFNIEEIKKKNGYYQQKYGNQLGIKYFDLFVKNLHFQYEFNAVRPYVYAHKVSSLNYAHYNQALAHPLGANFMENIILLNYVYKRFLFQNKIIYAIYGEDSGNSHYGKNIFKSDLKINNFPNSFNNTIGQGVKTTLINYNLMLSYLVNPKNNFRVKFNYTYRSINSDLINDKLSVYNLGISTDLFNNYYDF